MISLNKKIASLGIMIIIQCQFVFAQERYRCTLDSISQTGFYKILISPELSSYCKTDFSDIRITDSTGQAIPFIVRNSFHVYDSTSFVEFPILKNGITDSGRSILIIENKLPKVSELSFLIKNSSVTRNASLSGSNDKEHWYIIDEKLTIEAGQEFSKDSYIQSLQFPTSTYKYLKLIVNNAGTDPLDIQKAGYYIYLTVMPGTRELENALCVQNPVPSFIQKDSSDGKSYIKVSNTAGFQYDNINIDIDAPKFYSRTAEIFLPLNDSVVDKLSPTPVATIVLQHDADSVFNIPKQRSKLFYIVINNNDNPPLKIKSIITRQQQNELVAWLENGKKYFLLLDDPSASVPDYDLVKFRDSIPAVIPSVAVGNIVPNKKEPAVITPGVPPDKTWLWVIIGASGLLLTFLTFRLSAEMKKKGV